MMKPFVLNQHNKDFAALRTLRDEEMKEVYGGSTDQLNQELAATRRPGKSSTCTVTPNGDGGDDGADQG